ncbi:MAG: DUF4159 domain-containing protein, partial [Rubripirellula sp.]
MLMFMLKTIVPRCLLMCFIMLLVLPSTAQSPNGSDEQVDPNTSFFMGRIRYSRNSGNDCSGVGENMTRIVSEVSTIRIGRETVVAFTDPKIFETPFLFMNGHNDFVLGDKELESLRTYLEHGGFLFVSGCCTNPDFPAAWRREMSRLFADTITKVLPYEHPIYRSFYKITRVPSLHRNVDVHLEGLFYEGRLVS